MKPHYQTPLQLLRSGMDTADIATHLGCSEATAYNLIHRAREAERSNDNSAIKYRWPRRKTGLLPYAGRE